MVGVRRVGSTIRMGEPVRFGQRIPSDVGRNNAGFWFPAAICAVAVGTRENSRWDWISSGNIGCDGLPGTASALGKYQPAAFLFGAQTILAQYREGHEAGDDARENRDVNPCRQGRFARWRLLNPQCWLARRPFSRGLSSHYR